MNIASGIITDGLGGDATAMILGQFNLGFFDVTVTPIPPVTPPPPRPVSGYGGGDVAPIQVPSDTYLVTFNINRKGMNWKKSYVVQRKQGLIIIRITNILNTISDRVKVSVTNIRKKIGTMRINIWKR